MGRDEEIVKSYEGWLGSSAGAWADRRECELIMSLLQPRIGERLLDVGCKTGHHLAHFKRKGCTVTGVETSPVILEAARKKMGEQADLYRGDCDDLPFSDNEFDIVTMITFPEKAVDIRKAVSEAIRVSRNRVFLGVLNRMSLSAPSLRKAGSICAPIESVSYYFGPFSLIRMVKHIMGDIPVLWGSVIFLPLSWYPAAGLYEEKIPLLKNPFGAFVGISFPVVFSRRTLQKPIKNSLKTPLRGSDHVPGTATREIKQ